MVSASVLSMCVRVCSRMFLAWRSPSATRAVPRALQVEQADLELTGSDRSCPSAFDEDAEVPDMSIGDLSVSDIPVPVSLLPPASGAPSVEQGRFRRELHRAHRPIFASSTPPGTVRTYEATLRAIAPKVTAKLSSRLLPMGSECALFPFLAQWSSYSLSLRLQSRGDLRCAGAP